MDGHGLGSQIFEHMVKTKISQDEDSMTEMFYLQTSLKELIVFISI
jgi:hypothetical protein